MTSRSDTAAPKASARQLASIGILEEGAITLAATEVLLVGSHALATDFAVAGVATHRLGPGYLSLQLDAFNPRAVVVEESFVFTSQWQRWVDSEGRGWGPLALLADFCVVRRIPLLLHSAEPLPSVLLLDKATYTPSLTMGQLVRDSEYPDPVLEVLCHYSGQASADETA